jgi:hypothetical protein
MRAGWLVAAAAAAGVVVAGVHLVAAGRGAPVALRDAPVPTAAPAPPAEPSSAATAPPSAAATPPPPAPATPPPPTTTPAATIRTAPAVILSPAPLNVQPPALSETVPAGSPLSPLVTFTVTATGPAPVSIGAVSSTTPAFHILRDSCSRARLAPGGVCNVTVQLSSAAPGHHAGTLLVPVGGTRPAAARLDGTVR